MHPSRLLILGNGFDVHCGLASTYKSFFRSEILDTIGEPFGLKQLQAGVSGFWECLLLEYYKFYGEKDYNWCNVEEIIKNTLCSIFTQKKYVGTQLWRLAYEDAISNRKNDFRLNIIKNHIDFFLYKYCLEFFILSTGHADAVEQDLLRHLMQQLNNLEKRFCKYLKNLIVNPKNPHEINDNYVTNAVNLIEKLTGFSDPVYNDLDEKVISELKEIMGDVYPHQRVGRFKESDIKEDPFVKLKYTNILSFNYTPIFDILGVDSPCLYHNVHGKLCNMPCTNECNSSSIIFGIDDTLIQTQSETSVLRIFSKTYRKMRDIGKTLSILPPKLDGPIEIKFYGHSLSKADYSYFQSIFDYYDLYGNSNVSLTFYYSNGYEQHDAIYQLISEYGKSLTNKEQGKNLIHKLLLENRLQIQELEE